MNAAITGAALTDGLIHGLERAPQPAVGDVVVDRCFVVASVPSQARARAVTRRRLTRNDGMPSNAARLQATTTKTTGDGASSSCCCCCIIGRSSTAAETPTTNRAKTFRCNTERMKTSMPRQAGAVPSVTAAQRGSGMTSKSNASQRSATVYAGLAATCTAQTRADRPLVETCRSARSVHRRPRSFVAMLKTVVASSRSGLR